MNIDFNHLNELTRKYRASLNYLNENEQSLYNIIFNDNDYLNENIYFYKLDTERIVKANDQVKQIKDLQALTYYNHKFLNDLERLFNERKNNFKSNLNNFKKELKEINDSYLSNYLKIKENYNKVIRRSIFKEDDFNIKESMFDSKKNKTFLRSYACEVNKGCIESPYRQVEYIDPKRCLIKSRSISDTLTNKIENISFDPNYTFRKDKKFDCVISKRVTQKNNAQVNYLEAHLELIFIFNKIEDINQINIDLGSSLPILLEKDDLEYFNGSTYLKAEIYFSNESFNKKEYVFKQIRTNKIKLKLTQRKSVNNVLINETNELEGMLIKQNSKNKNLDIEENIKIFDLSIDHIEFLYKTYKQYGFYREKNNFLCKNLINFSLRTDEIKTSEYNFIEKEVILNIIKNDYQEDHIIPIAEDSTIREALYIKHKKATLTFPVQTSSIVIYRNEEILNSNLYDIEVLGENNDINYMYSCVVRFKDSFIYEVDDIFVTVYETYQKVSYNDDIEISMNSINISPSLSSKGYIFNVKPRFIFRNLSKSNTSDLIKSYTLLAVADEENISKSLTFKKVTIKEKEVSRND